ncbi:hypothetical protein DPMN_009009 [Dreissena polymorpha]|uniref:Uncharacterized protein n=1 Tax=Dreissena polymorpha TaxID=45954 RepID=A0A9D4MW59_DREPO|nr:hypothetical protein DPMN_009009 [Dreissena polymorpha]
MQPLDKGVFDPLKNQWYKTVRKHKEKYKKSKEEGINVQGVSPGYDTYVMLKSRASYEETTVESSNIEHSSNTPGSVSQETEDANLPTPLVQEE